MSSFTEKLKKLIRDSNPMNHKETFIEKCLNGSCSKIKENLDIIIQTNSTDSSLCKELGISKEEYDFFMEADDYYKAFQQILVERVVSKK